MFVSVGFLRFTLADGCRPAVGRAVVICDTTREIQRNRGRPLQMLRLQTSMLYLAKRRPLPSDARGIPFRDATRCHACGVPMPSPMVTMVTHSNTII